MLTNVSVSRLQRRAILRSADESQKNIRIEVIPGVAVAPRTVGQSYYWTTLSGKTVVRHPGAYRWPTMYHHSTRRVIVGELWLASVA